MHRSRITLEVNGRRHELDVDHRWTLMQTLREELDLTGAIRARSIAALIGDSS